MEKTKKGIPRSKLVGMSIYNPDGSFVGTVKDLSVVLGTGEMGIIVTTKYQTEIEIPWSNVGAAEDIVILKEAVKVEPPPTPVVPEATPSSATAPATEEKKGLLSSVKGLIPKQEKKICPTCGKPATYIKEYDRWYCYNCQKYID
ncbi:MAG: PRC-barrel domain-containing protein [Thermoproteota archaeon]